MACSDPLAGISYEVKFREGGCYLHVYMQSMIMSPLVYQTLH